MLAQSAVLFIAFGVILILLGVGLIIYVLVKSSKSGYSQKEINKIRQLEQQHYTQRTPSVSTTYFEEQQRKNKLISEWNRLDQERINKESITEQQIQEPIMQREEVSIPVASNSESYNLSGEITVNGEDTDVGQKLREIMSVSNRVRIDMVISILGISEDAFYKSIIDWANRYKFRIDGDYLIFSEDTVSEFIDELENRFSGWDKGKGEKKEDYKDYSRYSQI